MLGKSVNLLPERMNLRDGKYDFCFALIVFDPVKILAHHFNFTSSSHIQYKICRAREYLPRILVVEKKCRNIRLSRFSQWG